jgi:lipid-A-disaccharide synthase
LSFDKVLPYLNLSCIDLIFTIVQGMYRGMKIFFSVGEPSGDLHGANLIRKLLERNPDIDPVGYGGPRMATAGCRLHEDLTQLAVMGIVQVLGHLLSFWKLASRADRYFQHHRPDAVVLIDYPGFNWWIARRAKAHGIPVFYYGTPQIWAWAPWRVNKMRKLVDHVLCKLPFEEEWFRNRGCNATFVGHPYFDQLQNESLDNAFIDKIKNGGGPLIAILPGSRTQEVKHNLKWFLKAARIVHDEVPTARFAVASFKSLHAEWAQTLINQSGLSIKTFVGRTPELIAASHCTMACSGSVSLELLYHQKPTVILYWVPTWFYALIKSIAPLLQFRVKYMTLVNMLADEPFAKRLRLFDSDWSEWAGIPFPEFVTSRDKSPQIARHLIRWLKHPEEWERCRKQLQSIREEVAHGGASDLAAEYILEKLEGNLPPQPRPHFLDRENTMAVLDPVLAK